VITRRNIGSTPTVDGANLSGIAVVYGQPSSTIHEGGRAFVERIAPNAFGALDGADVKLYYNHDASALLARTTSKTLTLDSRGDGLHYAASLPDTTLGRDVRELMKRGDLSGSMSFGFFVTRDAWNAKRTERTVEQAKLVEISLVQDPAYPQTSSSLRHGGAAFFDAVAARLALHNHRMTRNG
jgi:HK97 family phage prohead protease